jgi:transcriptional regulator with XRE-family HTH domain
MSDERMIRLINLKAVMRRRGMVPADLARAMTKSDTYAGRIYNGKDPFSEKTARKIEKALGLPHKYLDDIHDAADDRLPNATPEAVMTSIQAAPINTGEPESSYGPTFSFNHGTNFPLVPVVAWASLGETLLRANKEWPDSQTRELPTSRPVSDSVKWVLLVDDHPVASLKAGDMVAIDPVNPHKSISRGQVALFRDSTGEHLLRRFSPLPSKPDAAPRFEAVDDDGRALDSERHGLTLIGVCVGRYTERI